MKTLRVVGVIVLLHCLVVGSVVLMQGCGQTTSPRSGKDKNEMPPAGIGRRPFAQLSETQRREVEPLPAGQSRVHIVAKGEYLSSIAQKYGVTTQELIDLNRLSNPDALEVDQRVVLPASAKAARPEQVLETRPPQRKASEPKPPKQAASKPTTESQDLTAYFVKRGDSLSSIAVSRSTTVSQLRNANKLASDLIYVGQTLLVPRATATSGSSGGAAVVRESESVKKTEPVLVDVRTVDYAYVPHVVQPGETLDTVARTYAVSVRKLMTANELESDAIKPGMELRIPQQE